MEKLLAMPSLCDTTDFGLSDESFNRSQGLKWLKRNPTIVEKLPNSTLYRVGSHEQGFFFLWEPAEKLVGYYIRYEVKRSKFHGVSVTQTALWRSLTSPDSEDMTRHVVFSILLEEYPAIMSDQIQTEEGRRFWLDLMTKALTRKYKVSLVNFLSRKILDINSSAELRLLSTSSSDNPWSWNSTKHRSIRFMIYRKAENDL